MNCPVCADTRMREVEKNGILIDICPSCKGVWLDRGELDKLMQGVQEVRQEYNQWYYSDDDDDDDKHKRRYPPQQPYPQQQPYPPQQQYQQQYQQQPYPQQYSDGKHKHSQYQQYPYKKKKKSVMDVFGDLFGGD
ncbi:zf-TFIIB domain-containing protein [Cohnella panacarvi]|uniref:TFIIB-type zinc ribbon-containing protein n=1 Tax=Cohnella panacarvi TaxID=400776 RepID=UPI00047B117F|nr:zf-TFIIB domain-containing protein [Cohnella panacarvi]